MRKFQSTLPARGATTTFSDIYMRANISIHAPREGSDPPPQGRGLLRHHFNPRSPRGERLILSASTHARATISIHAPREGSDLGKHHQLIVGHISIHAPREGSDAREQARKAEPLRFQSTLPARGATWLRPLLMALLISFQSTLPARGATADYIDRVANTDISIHAPREGSDRSRTRSSTASRNFNPRSPRGERRKDEAMGRCAGYFNPRSPRGERLSLYMFGC